MAVDIAPADDSGEGQLREVDTVGSPVVDIAAAGNSEEEQLKEADIVGSPAAGTDHLLGYSGCWDRRCSSRLLGLDAPSLPRCPGGMRGGVDRGR